MCVASNSKMYQTHYIFQSVMPIEEVIYVQYPPLKHLKYSFRPTLRKCDHIPIYYIKGIKFIYLVHNHYNENDMVDIPNLQIEN